MTGVDMRTPVILVPDGQDQYIAFPNPWERVLAQTKVDVGLRLPPWEALGCRIGQVYWATRLMKRRVW